MKFKHILNEQVQPTSKKELKEIIEKTIKEKGIKCDLNFIDVSLITDMSYLFCSSEFNGDISKWDVSKVKNMMGMFERSNFNGDISKWNVSNVEDMRGMFFGSYFNENISKWNVSKVKKMNGMFAFSNFNQDISKWDISSHAIEGMFEDCPLEKNPPKWYKKV